jgi:glucan 1,3-beta-glucosidase
MVTDMAMTGVNLGGWLVPEQWIAPSLFKSGPPTGQRFKHHLETFITPDDIAWLARHNVKAVRIPVPYIGLLEFVDPIVVAAAWHGMHVVIDLHTAPGSQNGWEHSGGTGNILWHTQEQYIAETLDAVEAIAKRYATAPNLWGIEVLNEPHWDVPHDILVRYYKQAYKRIRKHCNERVAVIVSDAFRPHDWQGVFPLGQYKNVVLDSHLYQCFGAEDKALNIDGHMQKVTSEWRAHIAHAPLPVMVGEWSGALDPITFADVTDHHTKLSKRQYVAAQQQIFQKAIAHFYWTYKTEQQDDWNFRYCVESGMVRLS